MSSQSPKVSTGTFLSALGLKQFWLVCSVCALAATFDIYHRFGGLVNFELSVPVFRDGAELIEVGPLGSEMHALYLERLKKHTKNTDLAAGAISARDDEVIELPSAPGLLLGSEFSYQLVAIFGSDEKFAVLKRFGAEGKIDQLLEVRIGEKLEAYTVGEILAYTLVIYDSDNKQVEIKLFRPAGSSDEG